MRHLEWWVGGVLIAAAAGLAIVHGARVLEFRRLATFHGPVVGYQAFAAFRGDLERCRWKGGQLSIRGWIARPGVPRGRHATRVVLRDGTDGTLYALRTDLTARLDVNRQLAAELGDGIDYTTSGFAAWVDLPNSRPALSDVRVYIAYDQGGARAGERYVLVPTDCAQP